jgi:hypothetical protein
LTKLKLGPNWTIRADTFNDDIYVDLYMDMLEYVASRSKMFERKFKTTSSMNVLYYVYCVHTTYFLGIDDQTKVSFMNTRAAHFASLQG